MTRKTITLITAFLTLFLLAGLRTPSGAQTRYTVPGWVYSYGGFLQNGSWVQPFMSVYDYGTFIRGGVSFSTANGSIVCTVTSMTEAPYDAWLYGTTNFNVGTRLAPIFVPATMTTHVWRGLCNGVSGQWIQAEVWSIADATHPSVLLWATGPIMPASSSVAVKEAALLVQLPKS